MKSSFFRSTGLFCFLFIIFSSCNKQKGKVINPPEFNQMHSSYVSAYTSGMIPKSGTVKVRFMDYVIPQERVGKEEDNFCFSFSPSVEGKVFWEDRRTIEFRPDEYLESGQVYNGTLDLRKIFDTISIAETKLPFQFFTKEQSAYVTLGALVPVTENKINLYYLDGSVITTEPEKPESVEQIFTINAPSKLKMKWTHDKNGTSHHFMIDSIERIEEAYNILVKWDGERIHSESKGEQKIEVPSLKDFKVIHSETHYEPEQFFVLTFSDPLLSSQELKGLIHSAGSSFSFLIENNSVKLFPASRLRGDVKIKIEPGIKNIARHKLAKGTTVTLSVNDIAPQVRLVGNGVIIPDAGGAPFPFEAINLNAVDVQITKIYENNVLEFLQFNDLDGSSYLEYVGKVIYEKKVPLTTSPSMDLGKWNRHALDLSSLIKTEPGAIYRVSIRFRKDYSLYECTAKPKDAGETNDVVTRRNRYNSLWDYYNYYYYDYNSEASSDPCKDYYYQNNYGVTRNFLVSDLGMMAKRGTEGSILFVVSDLKTAAPVSGVPVDIYDLQKQKIKTIETDDKGFAYFKSNDEPFAAVAAKGKQKGYLKLSGRQLSFSKFDIEGSQYQKGLKGFIYAERGVWRPGDSIFVNLILEDRQRVLPIDHPVIFEMTNPRGQIVQKMVVKESLNGFYSFKTATDLSAPTGIYYVRVNVGGAIFEKNLRVESIVPNRLKLAMDFDKTYITSDDKNIGELKVKWLHGAPAGGMKADVTAAFRKAKDIFPAYKDYIFDDPLTSSSIDSKVIFDDKLSSQGNALIANNLGITSGVSGALNVDLFCKVFEPGGNFSTDNFSTVYYPYKKYVGMKLPKGDGDVGVLFTDEEHAIDIVTLNKDGKSLNETVKLEMYKLEWRWWWDYYEDDLAGYNGRYYHAAVDSATIKTVNGKGTWKVKINKDDYGRFLIRACYPDGHCTGKVVYFDYPGWYSRRPDNTAGTTLLTFSSNKDKYAVGETAILDIPTGFKGKALVTIENGTSVIKADWIEAKKGKTTYSFTVTKDMAPNVYAYVTLLQPHAQTANDLPIRLYGVIPIHVNNPESHLKPVITMPEVLRPEQKVTVSIKEEHGKRMTYTIAMVDEGLLDLTKFKTPDPWPVFYAKEALQVTTYDLFDQVLGNHTSKIKKLLSIGGDMAESEPGQGSKVQRFKPMVKFLGPFYLEANKTATHTITMPKYVGSVRTMVVAGYDNAYGSAEKTTPVKSPLMVLGTLPRVLGPGEDVMLPVSVFAEEGLKEVAIEVKINSILTASGSLKQNLNFASQGEQLINFPLKVKQELGVGKVQILARAGKETASFDIELEVRAPNPVIRKSNEGIISSSNVASYDYQTFGMKGTNRGSLEVSSIPPLNLNERLDYLIQYPHGCLEQTTSSLFPQISLNSLTKLSTEQKRRLDYNVNAGLRKLRNFQQSGGGFGYWPGESEVNEWSTNYVGHFLLEAQKKGYNVPADMIERWKEYQKKRANTWVYSEGKDYLTQTYRLYLLALSGNPEFGAMNRMKESNDKLPLAGRWQLAGAYALSGQKSAAQEIVKGLNYDVPEYRELGYTFGSGFRDEAIILEVLSLMKMKDPATKLVIQLSNVLKSDYWLSTQETAYALLAMTKFGVNLGSSTLNIEYRINGGAWTPFVSNVFVCQVPIDVNVSPKGKVEIRNKGTGTVFSNVTMYGVPMGGNESANSTNLDMEVNFYTMDGEKLDADILEQGTDFIAEIKVTNPQYRFDLYEMALTYILPSGWQVHNPRMTGQQFNFKTSVPEYMDVRDDRINYYFDMRWWDGAGESSYGGGEEENEYYDDSYDYYYRHQYGNEKVFRIALNASFLGKFYLPAVKCEAMYDHSISATVPGRWVQVVKSKDKSF